MGWFRKKPDPISDRAKVLNAQIAQLEAQIMALETAEGARPGAEREARSEVHLSAAAAAKGIAVDLAESRPRLRSTAVRGHGVSEHTIPAEPRTPAAGLSSAPEAPIFEEVDQGRLETHAEGETTPEHYNDLGVRKYDLPALCRRIRNHFRGPSTTNPKLVSYLAAGGIQGLRPLRYEKRVARNRFIALVLVLFVILLGLLAAFVKR